MKSLKKIVALVAVAALSISGLVGCKKQKPIDNKEIVMTVGDKKVELGLANFFVRYQQSVMEQQMEMYKSYGYAVEWDTEVDKDKTHEESMKEDTLKSLQELYVLDAHAADYKVALTDDETAKIEEIANAFAKANTDDAKEKVSAEYAKEYLRLVTIRQKMYEALKASHTPEVKDDEAAQKIMCYVEYAKQTTNETGTVIGLTEEEVKDLKKDAKALLDGAKANGNLETYAKALKLTATKVAFSVDRSELDEKLVKAADKLELNGFTDVIESESAIYVAQVISLYNKEATEAEKKEIIEERKEEFYEETVEKWVEDTKIKVNDDVWATVSLEGLKISAVQPEEKEDKITEDTIKDSSESTEK